MTTEEVRKYLAEQEWIYAKTYHETFPHHYIRKDKSTDEFLFEEFLRYIRDNGTLKTFYSKQHIYLELDGYEYWEMGRPIKAVKIINKAIIENDKPYRFPKPTLKEEHTLKAKLNMRDEYLECILKKLNPTEEEQRHIKFLLNSERRIQGGGQNILDHSKLNVRYE